MAIAVQRTPCICGETLIYLNADKPSGKGPSWLLQIYHGDVPLSEVSWVGLDGYIYLARVMLNRASKAARALDLPCAGAWAEAADTELR